MQQPSLPPTMMAPLLETRLSNTTTDSTLGSTLGQERPFLSSNPSQSHHALDPDVLAIIIIRLREDLARTAQERDDAFSALQHANEKNSGLDAKVADLAEHLALAKEQNDNAERALTTTRLALQESDAQVQTLRTIVEDSRRGVLRLQAENRRKSSQATPSRPLPLDLSQHHGSNSPIFGQALNGQSSSPPSTVPFYRPLSALAHRRASSMSDPSARRTPDETQISVSRDESRRVSATGEPRPDAPSRQHVIDGAGPEERVDALKLELEQVQAALDKTSKELLEANDSREASEACIKALRDFIAEHAVGEGSIQRGVETNLDGLKLPPLPSETVSEQTSQPVQPVKKANSWGPLKLWREATNTPASPPTVPLTQAASSWRWSTSSSTPIVATSQGNQEPTITSSGAASFKSSKSHTKSLKSLPCSPTIPLHPVPTLSPQSSARTPSLTSSLPSDTSSPHQRPI